MRKLLLLAITFTLICTTSFAPKTSGDFKDLSKAERLYLTCKIWGFLKYYHPLVSKGSYDWDEKLQSVLKNTAHIKTHEQFSDFMAKWIYYMGQVPTCNTCGTSGRSDYFPNNFDLSWTQSSSFSDELKRTLRNIERNRFQGVHNYIEEGKAKQFLPKNESLLYGFNREDEYQRLIPLFRYWNYIEYFFPHKYQTDQDWDGVLKEMIPKFIEANSKLDLHLAMLELIVKIDDSHAGLKTPTIEEMPYNNYLPARIDLVEDQIVVTQIVDRQKALLNDLKVGDVLKTINGKNALDIFEKNKKYVWGSNDASKNKRIYHTLFMGIKESPQVAIERNGSVRTESLKLYNYSELTYTSDNTGDKWTILEDSIGYVDLGQLSRSDVGTMMGELMDQQFIIFDVRNSPKGTSRAIANYLNPSDTVFAVMAKPDLKYPGKFLWTGQSSCGEANPDYFKGNVILLVNGETQNNAEFDCMCLQTAPNVTIFGSQTAGTLGNVSKFPIMQRLYTSMTGVGIFYPDRSPVQRIGIAPDIKVERTIAGIRAGKDEILDKAIEFAQEEIERLKEIARLAELARLDSIRMDSIRRSSLLLDSLELNPLPMDSLKTDTLDINQEGRN